MKKINSNNINYTDNIYYICRTILIIGLPLTIISGLVLSHLSFHSSATSSGTDSFTVSISSACTLGSVVNSEHNIETNVGTYVADVGKTTITTLCNDGNGYSVYATGYSNNEEGNNKLINTEYPQYSINTGLATSGLTSQWAMKLNNIPDDPSPTPPTIESDYNDVYGIVPPYWTKVAERASGTTDMAQGSSFTTTYAVYASSSQYAGTYNGQVKYLLTHPSSDAKHFFMQNVAEWKDQMIPHEGDSIQAVDERDGKSYWVTRLADGNIWMTQNLDLDIGGNGVAALTSENTDISTDSSVYTSSGVYSDYTVNDGVYTWNPASTAVTSNYYLDGTAVKPSAWPTTDYATPYSLEGGDIYFYTSNSTSDDTRYSSLIDCREIGGHTEAECKRYFVGNYYNWTAAIASNNSSSVGSNNAQTANSICPKGWRLPNISQFNEFGKMLYVAGISANLSTGGYLNGVNSLNQLRSEPYYFVRPGRIGGDTLGYSGSIGSCWSSNARDNVGAYYLNYQSSQLNPDYSGNRGYGRPVRCIVR